MIQSKTLERDAFKLNGAPRQCISSNNGRHFCALSDLEQPAQFHRPWSDGNGAGLKSLRLDGVGPAAAASD